MKTLIRKVSIPFQQAAEQLTGSRDASSISVHQVSDIASPWRFLVGLALGLVPSFEQRFNLISLSA